MELAVSAVSPKAASLRFWYGASIAEFVGAVAEEIVGQLTLNSTFDIDRSQAAAWLTSRRSPAPRQERTSNCIGPRHDN
jgi:hypothetical protein